MIRPRRGRWSALGLVACLLAGCGSPAHSEGAPSTPSTTSAGTGTTLGPRLTQVQAIQLASVLYRDYQNGGASVTVNVVYTPGTTVGIAGDIDFQHHEGHLLITTVVAGQGTSQEAVDYTKTDVFEQGGPVVQQELNGHPNDRWIGRSPDPVNRPIDKIIEILVDLASPTRDNPLLLQQSDATFQGVATLDGARVNIYKYNAAITYYVGASDGALHRFVASVSGFSGPITVDITEPGSRSVPPPSNSIVLFVGTSNGSKSSASTS